MTLHAIQLAIAAALQADEWILQHGATVLAEDQGDIEAAVAEAVARIGLVAIVATPELTVLHHDGYAVAARAALRIAIYEEPAINRARSGYCTALGLGEHILIEARAWPETTPESLRQEPAGEAGVTVTAALSIEFIHDTTE